MYQETSRLAYEDIESDLNQLQQQVYNALQERGQASNMEIANHLGWSVNRVTPRMLELRTTGIVVVAVRRKCQITGNTCFAWRPA
jgi:Mn-dependent DtxR family transcriptional regulator